MVEYGISQPALIRFMFSRFFMLMEWISVCLAFVFPMGGDKFHMPAEFIAFIANERAH